DGGNGGQLEKILVTLKILGEQQEVIGRLLIASFFILVASRCDVCLNTDNWLDSDGLALHIEVERAIHHPVVGKRQSSHVKVYRTLHQSIQPCGAVEQREFRVCMKVSKAEGHFV